MVLSFVEIVVLLVFRPIGFVFSGVLIELLCDKFDIMSFKIDELRGEAFRVFYGVANCERKSACK